MLWIESDLHLLPSRRANPLNWLISTVQRWGATCTAAVKPPDGQRPTTYQSKKRSPFSSLLPSPIHRKSQEQIQQALGFNRTLLNPCMHAQSLSHVQLFATPWTVAHQPPLSMGFPRQVYQHGLPFPPPGDLPDPGIEPTSLALAGRFFTTQPPGKPC